MVKARDVLFCLGRPFSPFYGMAMSARAWLYQKNIFKRHALPVPVVSVGNLTMGGTGKTPFVMYIAKRLKEMGRNPAVVSRGYGGAAPGPVNVVSDAEQVRMPPEMSGDEPGLIAESLPGVAVITGAKRAVTGMYAVKRFGADVIVMDDGFQHMGLDRDLNLVLFSALSLLGNGRVFPGGDLREPVSALRRADAFVITGIDVHNRERAHVFRQRLNSHFPSIPVFSSRYRSVALLHSSKLHGCTVDQAKQMPLFAFCGLANPESFRLLLVRQGFQIMGFHSFKDHHSYSVKDIKKLMGMAFEKGGAALITTEKDYVKLKGRIGADIQLLALGVEIEVEKEFDLFLTERICHWGQGAGVRGQG